MKNNDKQKMENAVFNMILDHDSLNEQEKQLLNDLPNNDIELEKLKKIAESVTNLTEKPMPMLLKIKLMHRLMGFRFHFWQIFLVLFFLLSASGVLLFIDNLNNLGQVFQIIVGCFISLILIPMTFFIYFQYERQSIEVEKRIDYNLNHIIAYFKKWMDIKL